MLNEKSALNKNIFSGLSILLITFTVMGCGSNRCSTLGLVVEARELAVLLNKQPAEHLVILDVRSEAEYEKSHISGAVRVDPTEWKEQTLAEETGLEHETLWKNRIGALGINGNDPVLIYDDGKMTEAARIWFVFQHFGVPGTSVLNGGYPALEPLIKDGSIIISHEQTKPSPVKFEKNAKTAVSVALVERQYVRKAVEQQKAQVFDARTHEEYTGQDLRDNLRGGHIPNAINLPHKELLDEKGRLKSPDSLAAIFEKAGFRRNQPIIIHCDGGGRASLAALAAELAGYGPVMNYYLSFGDWAADASCPIEKPADEN